MMQYGYILKNMFKINHLISELLLFINVIKIIMVIKRKESMG